MPFTLSSIAFNAFSPAGTFSLTEPGITSAFMLSMTALDILDTISSVPKLADSGAIVSICFFLALLADIAFPDFKFSNASSLSTV